MKKWFLSKVVSILVLSLFAVLGHTSAHALGVCGNDAVDPSVLPQNTNSLNGSQLIDITPQIRVTPSAFPCFPGSKLCSGAITVVNVGANPIVGPIAVSLNDLTDGATLSNASGEYNGFPFVYENRSLNPGDSITIRLQFNNRSHERIRFTSSAYQVGPNAFLTTNVPYHPQQSPKSYEAPPIGFTAVFTEAIVRHGSRGLSSFDGTVYNMYLQALQDGALTPLGKQLGPDIMTMMKANALLDVGVPGITASGYGNLTQEGINEEEHIAARLLKRLPSYFEQLPSTNRQIVIVASGVNRAVDSEGFFVQSVTEYDPALAPLIVKSASLTAYPANKPVVQAPGVNRFLLYFHKLNAKTDLVLDPTDPYYQTYQDSLTYQKFLNNNTDMINKINNILNSSEATANARTVLEMLFTPDFVNKIDSGQYKFYNSGSYTFTTADGSYSTTVSGDGSLTVQGLSDAASELYAFYQAAPAMGYELNNLDFSKYIPAAQANFLGYLDDVGSFYQKGPGIAEDGTATFQMAQVLLNSNNAPMSIDVQKISLLIQA
jgi:hypothetical protein